MGNKVPVREGTFTEESGGALLANKCKSCGQIFFPKVRLCLGCLKEDMEDTVLSRQGKLYSYTIGHMASMHFEPPYAVGLVDMPERVRIFAPLVMMEDKPFEVGMDMEVVIDTLWQEGDNDVIGYRFKPV